MMPEEDAKVFSEAYDIWNLYRWTEMKTDDQWIALAEACRDFAEKHRWRENPLVFRIATAMIDALSDMYANGKKPKIPDYFGRDDL